MPAESRDQVWPSLEYANWRDTCATLHMWTQIVGKIRMTLTPWINHSWHVTLYLTARGLTTSPIPYGSNAFEIHFDFISHELRILANDGGLQVLELKPQSVAKFYGAVMGALRQLGITVEINTTPNEVVDAIPFERDEKHRSYDPEYANRFWRVLLQSERVFKEFRSHFCGKCSPVHFFWGSFDLAVTRFSGGPAPPHPGGIPHLPDAVTREAYSQEVSSLRRRQMRRFFNSPKALMMQLPLWPIGIGPRLWKLNPPCFQDPPKTPRQSEAATVEPIVAATALCRRAFGVADVMGR